MHKKEISGAVKNFMFLQTVNHNERAAFIYKICINILL